MKKVLILTNSINGLYNFRRELVHALIKDGYFINISAPIDTKSNYFNELGCNIIDTKINRRGINPISDIKLLFHYIKIIRQYKPNIVLTYTIKPNVYGGMACKLVRTPYITNITGLGTGVENKGILQKLTILLYKVTLNNASCVFFQNVENKRFLNNKGIAVENNRLIPGSGVNLEYFKLLEYPNEDKINFVFIGRIMKEKGIDHYLDAAEYIRSKYPNTVFHIIGNCEENYSEKLKNMQDKGYIFYHGRQEDVREFLKICHCTIHPSYYPEGMSNVLLESAACGRPIITTNRSGCKEIVDDGVNGYIVEQQSSKDLIKKIEKFLKLSHEEKKRMGLAGRAKVESEFNRRIVIDAYINEIKKVME